jgi:O-antigen/teichoic acid export membrane protein
MVASTIISSVGTILAARMLSPGEFGLYSVALTAPTLILNFTDWGMNSVIIKYSAQYNSEHTKFKVRKILFSGLLFDTILGLLLSILSLTLSGFLATNAFQRPNTAPLIQIASLVILTGPF